ncbi:MAG TPA: HPr family phosphocarrier protein [Phycisphaerales bacterium]|nr:HPr family phosphocarrier protein [Phycisphaerales bacterium]
MPTAKQKATIKNRLGMHARPAMVFVDLASTFSSSVTVCKIVDDGTGPVDGKSIMQMMMLAATQGTELEISADGEDAAVAAEKLAALVNRGFDEE